MPGPWCTSTVAAQGAHDAVRACVLFISAAAAGADLSGDDPHDGGADITLRDIEAAREPPICTLKVPHSLASGDVQIGLICRRHAQAVPADS